MLCTGMCKELFSQGSDRMSQSMCVWFGLHEISRTVAKMFYLLFWSFLLSLFKSNNISKSYVASKQKHEKVSFWNCQNKIIWMYIIALLLSSLLWTQMTQEIQPNLLLVQSPNKILLYSNNFSARSMQLCAQHQCIFQNYCRNFCCYLWFALVPVGLRVLVWLCNKNSLCLWNLTISNTSAGFWCMI